MAEPKNELLTTQLHSRSPTLASNEWQSSQQPPKSETAQAQSTTESELTWPEGGLRAWLVVLGAVCCNVVSFGYITSWGVFQSYYEQNLLSDESPSNIAWIGSIQTFLLFFPGLLGGVLFDRGYFKLPLAISSVVLVACTFLVGQCTRYWHFILCQGIASGLAEGMLFSPVMTVIGHWFNKRRGIALGITTFGSSVGGVIIPIAARKLIPLVGFPWAMRILGFIFLVLLIIPNVTLVKRLPTQSKPVWDSQLFLANPAYSTYVAAGFVAFLGFYVVLTYIDISAVVAGISEDFSFYLVAILNGVSAVGRLGAGKFADKIGSGNVVIPSLYGAAAIAYGWPFATTQGSVIAVAVLYGFVSGSYVATFAMPIYGMGDFHDLGRRLGMAMTVMSLSTIAGPPIAGALIKRTGGYEAAGYWAGSCLVVSASLAVWSRYLRLNRRWTGKF